MLLSTSENNVSFLQYLTRTIRNEDLHMAYGPWIQFLQDHRMLIREQHSSKIMLTEEIMNRYQYRVRSFLSEHLNYTKDLDQAFRVVNKLNSDMDFILDLQEVYIPDPAYISELRDSFMTALSQIKKL